MNTEFTVYYQGLENLQTSFTASGLQARARLDKTGQFIIIILFYLLAIPLGKHVRGEEKQRLESESHILNYIHVNKFQKMTDWFGLHIKIIF